MKLNSKLEGILWMVVSCFFSACMMSAVRYLSADFHPFQVAFFRNFFSLILFLPWLVKHGPSVLKTTKMPQYCFRAVMGLCAMFMWFYALTKVPLSEATALSFTSPLMATFAAIIFLKEKTNIYRLVGLGGGFFGTLIILRPGFAGFNYISLFVLVAAIFWSTSSLLIKSLTKTEKPEVIVFYMTLMMTPLSLPVALLHWRNPAITEWPMLFFLGIVASIFQVCLSKAFAKADLTVILPFDFLRLLFTAAIAYFAFTEVINIRTIIGGTVILGSTLFVTYKEARSRRKIELTKAALKTGS